MGFTNAKTLTPVATVKAKSDRPELHIAGVEKLASLAALIEALQTRYTTLDDIKAEAGEYMIDEGVAAKR